jgi:predicted LPLAT superfamily acyltransferase
MPEQKRHWSHIQENGSVLGIKTLLFIYQILGRTIFSIILRPVMLYYYLSNRMARESSKQYISYVSPYLDKYDAENLSSFRHFCNFGDMMLDKLLVWMDKIEPSDIEFKTPSVVDGIKASGKGAIIIVSHLGNIEVCNALRQKLAEVKLTVLVNTEQAEKFNSIMRQLNSNASAELIQVNEMSPATAMLLSERINNGELIVIAGDRTPERAERTSDVEFFGKIASMPQGAFILASILKCPIYLLFCLKHKSKYHIYVEKFSDNLRFARKTRQAQLDEVVQRYASRLQYYCLKAPLQWYNFFPFWQSNTSYETKPIDKLPKHKA